MTRRKLTKKQRPVENGGGRDINGRFIKGNSLGKGKHNVQFIEKSRQLKKALINAVSENDIKQITKKLIAQAKTGDIAATRELYDRLFGKAPQEVDFGDETRKTIFDILAVCGLNGGGNGD